MKYESTKIIELGSCAFRQWKADSHCKYIHGYRLIGKFWFDCNQLDERNWVVDFGGLKELKQVLEKQFDHTLCISADDPQLELFKHLHSVGACDLRVMQKGVGIERTAEWCYDVADAHVRGITNNRCWVSRVEVWEHDKNSAIVSSGYRYVPDHNPYASDKHIITNNTIATTLQPSLEQVNVVNAGINVEMGAPLGTKITKGMSNPFAGTSWSA